MRADKGVSFTLPVWAPTKVTAIPIVGLRECALVSPPSTFPA
jgi:hypothetical protein